MDSGISKWLYRQMSQEVCPWNVRFSRPLPDDSLFAPRLALAGKDTLRLARELLAMTQEKFSAAFKNSPMRRAKLRGLKRNAAVVLGSVGGRARAATTENAEVLTRAIDDPEPVVREHAAWALDRIGSPSQADTLRHLAAEIHALVVDAPCCPGTAQRLSATEL